MTAAALVLLFASDAEELYRRGVAAFERREMAEAVSVLTEAARLAPKNAQIWKVLGITYASTDDYERAAAPLAKACELAPKLVDACYYYGRNLYALNQFDRSLEVLRQALPHDRAPSRVHLALAQNLEALGQAQEAEREFQVAIKTRQSPRPDFDPRLHYAVFLFRQGRTAEALAPAKAVAGEHPDSGRARFELGRIEYQLGHLDAAVADFQIAAAAGYAEAQPMLAKARARLKAQKD